MEYKYKAFISYNHNERDSRVARTLHNRIETYTVPRKLRKNGKKKPGKVFRDQEELSASSDLNQHIRDALDESEFLIVICSPGAVASRWVSKEIAYFLEHHAQEKLLTVLTGGDGADIYKALLPGMPEPLSLDLTGIPDEEIPRKLKERFLKLCAPLLGCEYDDLVMRDQKRQRRIFLGWLTGITAVAAVIIGILLWSNWQIEGKNRELDQKNEELDRKNEELEQQNRELLLRESEILTQEALEALENNDQVSAVRNALDALPSAGDDRPYYAPAEQALWSALDLLDLEETDALIPRDTVLEQATDIHDYCISPDGRLLTTADDYGLLTCFDTSTGAQVWSRTLVQGTEAYGIVSLYPCETQSSILVRYSNGIFSVDQATGTVNWFVENYDSESYLTLSPDGRYAVCILCDSRTLDLAYISTEDGTILDIYPVAASDRRLSQSITNTCAFSSDGSLFAGSYSVETDEEDQDTLVYFVTDLTTGETQTILRQTVARSYDTVYSITFTDQDTTLTIVRKPEDLWTAAILEKVSIPDQELLWQMSTPSEIANWISFGGAEAIHLIECDGGLLLGSGHFLYALDPATGELLTSKRLDSPVVLLEPAGGWFYALTLENGTHSFGWLNGNNLLFLKEIDLFPSSPLMELGPLQDIALWNDGYMRVFNGEYGATVSINTEENGFGYAAVMPQDNNRTIVIKRVAYCSMDLSREILFTTDPEDTLDWPTASICGPDTIMLEQTGYQEGLWRYSFLDRTSCEVMDSLTIEDRLAFSSDIHILSDGAGIVYENRETYDIYTLDTKTKQYTLLFESNMLVPLTIDDVSTDARYYFYIHGRLSDDHKILIAAVTARGLKLWIDAEAQADTLYPDALCWPNEFYVFSSNLSIGGNGYILMDLLEGQTPENDRYFLYNVYDRQWYEIPFCENDTAEHVTCLGETSPVFTVMDSNGLIRSWDIRSGKQTMEVSIGLNSNAVSQLRWILEDRYLAILTSDSELLILDGTTGETVYQYQSPNLYISDPSFAADRRGERLYIWGSNGICVDIASWTTLAEIQKIDLYDPVTDRVLYVEHEYQEESDTYSLVSYRLPTTEELIGFAHDFLGE